MARIRTIKPEFPHSESMGRVSRESRLCFIMLWTIADDQGRLRGNSRMLASLLFPYDDDAKDHIDGWLSQLSAEGCIDQYEVSGTSYIQIANWGDHQKIDKPSQSKIPEFDESSRILANPREVSSLEGNGRDQGKEVDQGGDKPRAPRKPASHLDPSDLVAEGVDLQHAKDWRTARKSPITPTAWEQLKAEAAKAGLTPAEAVRICAIKGWRGFDSSWNWRPNARASPQNPSDTTAEAARLLGFDEEDVIDA